MDDYRKYYGFVATWKDGKLIDIEDLYTKDPNYPDGRVTEFVRCGRCGSMMDPKPKSWKCPKCGAMVRYSTLMEAVDDDTRRTAIDEDSDYEDYY